MKVGTLTGQAINDGTFKSDVVRYKEGDGYLNDIRLESFGHLLADYIISGANITRDLKDRKKLTVSEGIISFGDQLWRVYGNEFRTSHIGTSYYLGFLLGQGYVFSLSQPVEKYLPLWEVITDGKGDILSTKDVRGELGRVKFKAIYDGVYLNTAEVQAAIDNAIIATNEANDAANRVDDSINGAQEATVIALNAATATNLVKVATQVVKDETILVKDATNLMKNETETVKNATTLVKNETNVVKEATTVTRNETILVKDETIVVKNATNVVKEDTLLVKNETNTVKNATEAVRVATNIVKDETNAVKNATNLVKDATLVVKAETETATQATKNATTAAITATGLSKTATDNVNVLIHNLEGLESRNIYSPTTTYIKNNIVSYGGTSYIAKVTTLGNTPTILPGNSHWSVLAEKGEQGDRGERGEMGAGVTIKGELPAIGDLPSVGEVGDAYIIGSNLYIWNGSSWFDGGPFRGPTGPKGEPGVKGEDGGLNPHTHTIDEIPQLMDGTTRIKVDGLDSYDLVRFHDDIISEGGYYVPQIEGGTKPVITKDGTLYYQGVDTDQRYANKAEMTSDIDAGMFGDVITGVPIDGGVWI